MVDCILDTSGVAPIVLRCDDNYGGRRTDEFAPGADDRIFVILGAGDGSSDDGLGDGVVGDSDGGIEG